MKSNIYKNRRKMLKELTACALFTALLCVSSMIYIPLSVPITAQSFVLFFGLFYLGGKITACASALYIAIGALGLPVFSGFSGGAGRLLDATGGFIMGMLICSAVYFVIRLLMPRGNIFTVICAAIAHIVLYLCGLLWYALVYLNGSAEAFASAFLACVLPFILPDILKAALAFVIAKRLPKLF